jgi:mono/diheme cytochrome c family protein
MRKLAYAYVLAFFALGCQAEGNEPGWVVTPGMVESVPADPYAPNSLTPTGRTMMAMPEGTLAYGTLPYTYGATKEETARAGRELSNPIVVDAEVLKRGQFIYETYCHVCHGANGEGDGPVIGAGRFPNPANLQADHTLKMEDGALFNVLTMGQGLMPTYALQVLAEDRWKVIHYVHHLQNPPVKEQPAESVEAAPAELGGTP